MNRIGDAFSSIIEKRRIHLLLLLLLLCGSVVGVVILTYTLYPYIIALVSIYHVIRTFFFFLYFTSGFLLKDNRMPPLTELDNGLPWRSCNACAA